MTRSGFVLALLVLLVCDVAFLSPALFTPAVRAPADVTPHWPPFRADRQDEPPAPRIELLNDWLVQFHPWQHLVREAWSSGRAPLWNSQSGCGEPLLANLQCGALSPYLPIVLLAGDQASDWQQLAQLVVTQIFCLLLAAHLGLSSAAGVVLALAWGFSSFLQTWALHPHAASASFAPGVLWALLRLVARPSTWRLLIAAACVALSILAGHVETAAKFGLAAGAVVLLQTVIVRPPCGRVRAAALVLASGACGLLLAACVLLPFADYASQSNVRAVRAESIRAAAFPLVQLATLLDPDWFGTAVNPATYRGAGSYTDGVVHVGVVALGLAAVGLVAGLARRPQIVLPLLAVGAAGVLVACGPQGIRLAWAAIPGLGDIRPSRGLSIGILPLAVFAAFGLDALARAAARFAPRAEQLVIVVLVVATALTSAIPWRELLPTAPAADLHPPSRALDALRDRAAAGRTVELGRVIPGGFGELWGFPRLVRYDAIGLRRYSAVFAPADQTFPVFPRDEQITFAPPAILDALSVRWVLAKYPAAEARLPSMPWPIEAGPGATVELAAFVDDGRLPEILIFRGYGQGVRDGTIEIVFHGPDLDTRWTLEPGGWVAAGGDPPAAVASTAIEELVATQLRGFPTEVAAIPPSLATAQTVTFRLNRPAVSYWVSSLRRGGVGRDLADAADFGWLRIDERKTALPFAWLATSARRVEGEAAAVARVRADGFDPHVVTVIEAPANVTLPADRPLGPAEGATIVSRSPGRIEVAVETASDRVLVVGEAFARGWEATIDGKDATVRPANAITMGVLVPAGSHTVLLRYAPASFLAGCAISVVTLLGLVVAAARGAAKRRRPGSQRFK